MAYYCWSCSSELHFEVKYGVKVGREDTCPHCVRDLHVCRNCTFYDPDRHNRCRETEAPFIRDRELRNFCHLFDFRQMDGPPQRDDAGERARARLEALFRRPK